ncbi:MAG: hypothetical protein GF364_18685 [Candidatus Lokiarchaeota archaeon]|nr:hypothetical protein [Candidatus Lokiarchaeota archaeon]
MASELTLILVFVGLVYFLIFVCAAAASKRMRSRYPKPKPGHRYRKLKRVRDPKIQAKVRERLTKWEGAQYEEWYKDTIKKINYKYRTNQRQKKWTVLKRAVLDIINKYTYEIPEERLKKFSQDFPLLRRVYFGPKLNKQVYNKKNLARKFKFKIKDGTEIPHLDNIVDIALFFNTSVNVLLGYAYTQDLSNKSYYIKKNYTKKRKRKDYYEQKSRFYNRTTLIKPDGRKRLISSPKYNLKNLQLKILHDILEKAELPDCCTGFKPGNSIVDNAKPHIGKSTMVQIDLYNFFPSLKFDHVFEVFRGFGYSRPVSGVLAGICTDFCNSPRFVPQGAPTSPMISNLYASHLDKRLKGLWTKRGFTYTRYADDLTFSSDADDIKVGNLIHATYEIIKDENLKPNYKKTKVYRKGHRHEVTGIVVNDKLSVNRDWIRELRAELHNYNKNGLPDGIEGQQILNKLQGKISFLNMVDPEKAARYRAQFAVLTKD